MHSGWIPKLDVFLKQMARCSYGNLSSSSLNMKMLNRWSRKLPSLLWLSLTLFYSPSHNKLTWALWDTGQTKKLLLFYWQKLPKLCCCYVLWDAALADNITKKNIKDAHTHTVWACFLMCDLTGVQNPVFIRAWGVFCDPFLWLCEITLQSYVCQEVVCIAIESLSQQ